MEHNLDHQHGSLSRRGFTKILCIYRIAIMTAPLCPSPRLDILNGFDFLVDHEMGTPEVS